MLSKDSHLVTANVDAVQEAVDTHRDGMRERDESVAERSQELGIRLALGANPRAVVASVVGHSLLLTVAGVGVGLVAASALARLAASMLFDTTAVPLVPWACSETLDQQSLILRHWLNTREPSAYSNSTS